MNLADVLNALALAALLTLLASGLTMIYGLRDIMNFAHGSLYMVGAYLGASIVGATSFWVSLVTVPILLGLIGIVLEIVLFRRLARKPPIQVALITFGLGLVIQQVVILIYGSAGQQVNLPAALNGAVHIFGVTYPTYRLVLIGVAVAVSAALGGWLGFTRSGMYVRATSQSPETARLMGVHTDRLGLVVTCVSVALAGLAGALAGPYLAVQPDMGDSILIISLTIVIIGGVGSIPGAFLAALLVGFVQVIGQVEIPSLSTITPFILLIVVILVRPQGLLRGRELA